MKRTLTSPKLSFTKSLTAESAASMKELALTSRFTLRTTALQSASMLLRFPRNSALISRSTHSFSTKREKVLKREKTTSLTRSQDSQARLSNYSVKNIRGYLKGVSLRDYILWKNIGIVWSDPAMPIFSVLGVVRFPQ